MNRITLLLAFLLLQSYVWAQSSISATWTLGDISTNYQSYNSACSNSPTLSLTLPAGDSYQVTGIDITYDMTATAPGFMADQRSAIYNANTDTQEADENGAGNLAGTYSYNRAGVSIANGIYPGGTTLDFEIRPWRTYDNNSGCGSSLNQVDNNTWTITVHYMPYVSEGRVGVGTLSPDESAMLDVTSSSKGVLIPRMPTSQINAIPLPATGLLAYDTDVQEFKYYNGTSWLAIGSGTESTDEIADGDGDTKIQVEETADEDRIRFDIEGNEIAVLDNGFLVQAEGNNSRAIHGIATTSSETAHYGVYGEADGIYGRAVYGRSGGTSGAGVYGLHDAESGSGYGGYFQSMSPNGNGLWAQADGLSGTAVRAIANGSDSEAIYGSSTDGFAGRFVGNTRVDGEFSIGSFSNEYNFPLVRGTAGQILQSDGSGNLTWVNNSGSGGSDKIIDADSDTEVTTSEQNDNILFKSNANWVGKIDNSYGSTYLGRDAEAYTFDTYSRLILDAQSLDVDLVINDMQSPSSFMSTILLGGTGSTDYNTDAMGIRFDGPDDELQILRRNPGSGGPFPTGPTWSNPLLTVRKDGRVRIGNVNPSDPNYMLAVDGNVVSEEVLIQDSGSWPDYVFKKEYQLRSLQDVQEYINQNGHLPDVPSATEVEVNGIASGDMHKIQMRKIEELTLYIIALEKRIHQLENQDK